VLIRVLVVDDSAFARQALIRMLRTDPGIEVVGMAADGHEAVEKTRSLEPDVVTLDVQMPRMGGLEALEQIMKEHPVPVLLLSSLTQEGGEITLRGLELGAMDFVDKSSVQGSMNLLSLAEELKTKIHALAGVRPSQLKTAVATRDERLARVESGCRVDAVVIAASTGGPTALQAVIPRLPEGLDAAVLVVQHMPPGFTKSLAERLDTRSALPVREAADGDAVEPGLVLLAPAGLHMKLRRRAGKVKVLLDEEPRSALHRPSADVLMSAAARVYGAQALGVVLTGMGSDGTEGLRAIRNAGGITLAEREDTCIIYGMPKSAVEAGVVDRAVPLGRMANEILTAL
jgi:two-component system chemotaxis response regulator CheB